MIGATHSHNPEYPDDQWNLYTQIVPELTVGLNVANRNDVLGIFKPWARRLQEPTIFSDGDAEILLIIKFVSPVHIRKIIVAGGSDDAQSPSSMRCFVNIENLDFTNIEGVRPAQVFQLPVNADGNAELITQIHAFSNINTLTMFFPANHGEEDVTAIKYIGMQGEHTHYRREAVDAVYEVLCNGQDIEQPEDALGGTAHMH
jgi:hypothetical protein